MFIAALGMVLAVSASASDWQPAGVVKETAARSRELVAGSHDMDVATAMMTEDSLLVWFRSQFPEDVLVGATWFRSSTVLRAFRCGERMSATLQSDYYDGAGKVVKSTTVRMKDAAFGYVVPDSVGEAELAAACALPVAKHAVPSIPKPPRAHAARTGRAARSHASEQSRLS